MRAPVATPARANHFRHTHPRRVPIRRDLLPLVRTALGEQYRIECEIARGGAARVFKARDAEDRPVALKILRPELLTSVTAERFLREIGVMANIDHPHICRLLDYGERDWLVYYVMPFVPGPNLRQHLDRVRRASVSDTIRIARDLLDALAHAHGHGIVHRDVKPENIVLSTEGAILLDFGIARAIAASGTDRLTRSGFTVGTSHYMSPEQTLGAQDIDHRSDVYSLGCVLFECLAGRPPFMHASEALVLHMQQSETAPDVRTFRRDAPAPLAEAIATALEKSREARWQTAKDMWARIDDAAAP